MTYVALTGYRGWRGSPRSVSEISQLGSFSHHLSALRLISLVKTRCTTTDERSRRSTSRPDPIPVLKQHKVNLRLLHPFINLFHQQSTSSGLNINVQTGIAPDAIPRPSAAFHLGEGDFARTHTPRVVPAVTFFINTSVTNTVLTRPLFLNLASSDKICPLLWVSSGMALGEVGRVVGLVGFKAFPANRCGGLGRWLNASVVGILRQ